MRADTWLVLACCLVPKSIGPQGQGNDRIGESNPIIRDTAYLLIVQIMHL
jgi:hypothetical protein